MPEQPAKLLHLPENWNRALAIAAHPDDLEYGAASAIARWTSQGKQVGYLMVTKGEAGIDSMHPDETARLRMQEEINSARVVESITSNSWDSPMALSSMAYPSAAPSPEK